MGCCESQNEKKQQQGPKKPPEEKEISIQTYDSKYGKYFKDIEGKNYNFFLNIPFIDMAYALKVFSLDNATVDLNYTTSLREVFKGEFEKYMEIFDEDLFHTFLDNKVKKHSAAYEKASKEEEKFQVFNEYFLNIYKALLLKLEKEDKKKEQQEEIASSDRIKKFHCLAFFILFCQKSNVTKVKLIFNLFSTGNAITKSTELEEFLLTLFFIAAYCSLDARHKINADGFNEMDRDEIKKLLDAMEAKDSLNLVKETMRRIFGENGDRQLSYEQFKALFTDKGEETTIDYILTTEGVRKFQEKYNV